VSINYTLALRASNGVLPAAAGAFALSGQSASLRRNRSVAAVSGSFAMSGQAVAPAVLTRFTATENPLSGGGLWITNDGLDWTPFRQDSGYAYATHAGTTDFKDSYAYINPSKVSFPADQRVQIELYQASMPSGFTEYEILLRVVASAHSVTLVECNLAKDGQYAEIIGWKGPLGVNNPADFDFYSTGNPVSGVADGGIFEAQIVGNQVTTWYNGTQIATASIAGGSVAHPSGQPGIGGFTTSGSATEMKKIGMKRFKAWGL